MAFAFVLNTKSEFIRVKRTASFWLTLVAAGFIPGIMTLMYIFKHEHFVKKYAKDAWSQHFAMAWEGFAPILLPMFVVLVCSLVVQVEYRNNTWKQVYASPRSYADIFFSKFIVIQFMILSSFVLFILFTLLAAVVPNIIRSGYQFINHTPDLLKQLRTAADLYISILAITSIQYWLSLRFKNYIAPLGIGLALLVGAIMLMGWENIHVYPFAYPLLTFLKYDGGTNNTQHLPYWSVGYFVLFLMLAFVDSALRKERG